MCCALLRLLHMLNLPVKVQQLTAAGLGVYLLWTRIDPQCAVICTAVAVVVAFLVTQREETKGEKENSKYAVPVVLGGLLVL